MEERTRGKGNSVRRVDIRRVECKGVGRSFDVNKNWLGEAFLIEQSQNFSLGVVKEKGVSNWQKV